MVLIRIEEIQEKHNYTEVTTLFLGEWVSDCVFEDIHCFSNEEKLF